MFRTKKDKKTSKSEPTPVLEVEKSADGSSPAVENADKPTEKLTRYGQKVEVNNKLFKVKRLDVRDPDTGEIVHSTAEVCFKEYSIINVLQSFGVDLIYAEEDIRRKKPYAEIGSLLSNLEIMKKEVHSSDFTKLVEWLDGEMSRFKVRTDKLIAEGKISFDALWYLFPKLSKACAKWLDRDLIGGKVIQSKYRSSMFGTILEVTLQSIKSNGNGYFKQQKAYTIRSFQAFQRIESLTVKPMTDKMFEDLNARGKLFAQVALGHHYMRYDHYMIYQRTYGTQMFKAEGRIMCDTKTFQRMRPEYEEFKMSSAQHPEYDYRGNIVQPTSNEGTEISANEHYMCWPTIGGFSFAAKAWGEIMVSRVTSIEFDTEAYDRLVLAEDRKVLIKALVDQQQSNRTVFRDIISGKGGGRIFLSRTPGCWQDVDSRGHR